MPGNTRRHISCPLQGYHPDDIQKGMCSRRLTVYKPLFFDTIEIPTGNPEFPASLYFLSEEH